MKIPTNPQPSKLESSGMADVIRDGEAASRALLDEVVSNPSNMVALAAYNQSLKDRELLMQVVSGTMKRNGDAQDAVVRNLS